MTKNTGGAIIYASHTHRLILVVMGRSLMARQQVVNVSG
jgi:hypothetical protein